MKVTSQTLWLPKNGNSEEEYEDAAAPVEPVTAELRTFKCAIADGATETSFSRLWARLLVDGFVGGTDIGELRRSWAEAIEGKQLAWYAEEKAQSGAYAALLRLTIESEKDGGTWHAEAIGDSCLVIVRGSHFLLKFPLTRSEQFNSNPALLSSNPEDGAEHEEQLTKLDGEWKPGDAFYLLTDALARWTYKRQEEHCDAAVYLQAMRSGKDLLAFADVQRKLTDEDNRPLMRNDDVTLMRVIVE